jgi:hypothetical protein
MGENNTVRTVQVRNVFHKRVGIPSESAAKTLKIDYHYDYYTTTLYNDPYSTAIDS